MVRVYIIRHGETEPNTRFACLGRLDVPLNERGKRQASELCRRIDTVCADAVLISPLRRARETVSEYCSRHRDIPVITEPAFTERDYGEWDNMTFAEIEDMDPVRYAAWQADFTGYRIPGGESSAEVHSRVGDALNRLLPVYEGKTIFIVTHLGTARHIISNLLALSLKESWRFTFENARAAVIDFDNSAGYGVLKSLNI